MGTINTYICDVPGCCNTLEDGITLCDVDWEFRNGGDNIVCNEHRHITSEDLELLHDDNKIRCSCCGDIVEKVIYENGHRYILEEEAGK